MALTTGKYIHRIAELEMAGEHVQRMIKEALPKFNWGASALDANAIQLLNEAPIALAKALENRL